MKAALLSWTLPAILVASCGGSAGTEHLVVGTSGPDGSASGTGGLATGDRGSGGEAVSNETGGAGGAANATGSGGSGSSAGSAGGGGSIGTGGRPAGGGAGGTLAEGGAGANGAAGTAGHPPGGGAGGRAVGGSQGTGGAAGQGGAVAQGGTNGGCGVDPVTPNATQKTRNALCYLYQIYGSKILSGQEENNDDDGMNYISANTGKIPAIRSFDVNNTMAPTQCVAHSKNNGLCMFGYHMGIVAGDGYQSAEMKTDINTVLTEGSTYNQTFKTRLDNVARMVQTVQDADGVAIMRLFHEAGGTWFWWSMEGGAQYIRLYKYAFDYLTVTKGLRNMIWLLPYDGSPDPSFYPGKSLVDIGGADTYAGDGNYDSQNALYEKCVGVFGSQMPIALHECGPVPDPPQLMSTGTKWVLFNVWTAPYYEAPSNSVDHLKSVYTSSYVITRDEMPTL